MLSALALGVETDKPLRCNVLHSFSVFCSLALLFTVALTAMKSCSCGRGEIRVFSWKSNGDLQDEPEVRSAQVSTSEITEFLSSTANHHLLSLSCQSKVNTCLATRASNDVTNGTNPDETKLSRSNISFRGLLHLQSGCFIVSVDAVSIPLRKSETVNSVKCDLASRRKVNDKSQVTLPGLIVSF